MKSRSHVRNAILSMAAMAIAACAGTALAQKKYDPGASDTEIKIGNTMAYSGPASVYGVFGKTYQAYFNKVNAEGGINGRKINFISYDDALSPPKTVEQYRKLVEQDGVLLIFGNFGTPGNLAVRPYMNQKKVPHLCLCPSADRDDPTKREDFKNFPWTMGLQPSYFLEGKIYGRYLAKEKPNARIAVLSQNDDYGREFLNGFKAGLGSKAGTAVVAEETYEPGDASVDSQVVKLKASNADVFLDLTIAKFTVQAIRKAAEIGWKPLHVINTNSISISSVLKPAGLDNAQGLVSASFYKDPTDPRWKNDAGVKEFHAFLDKYYPDADRNSNLFPYAYLTVQHLVEILKQSGDNLTRENVMRQAANIKDQQYPLLLPGIKYNTSSTDYQPLEQMQLIEFKGERWELIGGVINSN